MITSIQGYQNSPRFGSRLKIKFMPEDSVFGNFSLMARSANSKDKRDFHRISVLIKSLRKAMEKDGHNDIIILEPKELDINSLSLKCSATCERNDNIYSCDKPFIFELGKGTRIKDSIKQFSEKTTKLIEGFNF